MSSGVACASCARRLSARPSGPATPGQVLQLDWLELPTRPRIAGRQRRIYALLGTLPYDNLRSVVARRERDVIHWNRRFLHLRGHYAFHATACTPQTPREKGSGRGRRASPQDGILAGAADRLASRP